jgi:uncharacterized protein (DUF2141 family)
MKTMTKVWFAMVLLCATQGMLRAQSLEVTVTGIESLKGSIRVGLFNDAEKFLETPLQGRIVKATAKTVKVVFENVPAGTYAVSIIHDENENGELDTNLIGIPKEGFGFSNNVMGKFGPPSFKDASFIMPATRSLSVTAKYL